MSNILFQIVRSQILRLFLILVMCQIHPVCEIPSQGTQERPFVFSHEDLMYGECEEMTTLCEMCPPDTFLDRWTIEPSKQCNRDHKEISFKVADYLRYFYLNLKTQTDKNGILKRTVVDPKGFNFKTTTVNTQRKRFIVDHRSGNQRMSIHDSCRGFVGIYDRNFYHTFCGNSSYCSSGLKFVRGHGKEANTYLHNANENQRFFSLEHFVNSYLKVIISLIYSIVYTIFIVFNFFMGRISVYMLVEVLCVDFIQNSYKFKIDQFKAAGGNRCKNNIHELKESVQKKCPFVFNFLCNDTVSCKADNTNEEGSQYTCSEDKLAQREQILSSPANSKTNKKLLADNCIEMYAENSVHCIQTSSQQKHNIYKYSSEEKHDNRSVVGRVSHPLAKCCHLQEISGKDDEEKQFANKMRKDESKICKKANNINDSNVYFPKDTNECTKQHVRDCQTFERKAIINAPEDEIKEDEWGYSSDRFQTECIDSSVIALKSRCEISFEVDASERRTIESISRWNYTTCDNANNNSSSRELLNDHIARPKLMQEVRELHPNKCRCCISNELKDGNQREISIKKDLQDILENSDRGLYFDNNMVINEDFVNIKSVGPASHYTTSRNESFHESFPRLATHMTRDVDPNDTKYQSNVFFNAKKIEDVKADRKSTKNKDGFCLFREKNLKLPVSKLNVWSLEKYIKKELHWSSEKRLKEKLDRPYFHHDYRSFSREWHRSSIFQRSYQVYTLLSMQERIETFKYWPVDSPVSKIDLVEAGFIYKGDGYEVFCGSCNLVKSNWTYGDVPLQIHKMLKPECEFLITTFPDLIVTNGQNVVDSSFPCGNEQSLINKIDAMSISFPNFEQSSSVGYFPQAQASGGNLSQQPFNPFLSSMPPASAIPQQPMFNTSPVNPGESFPVAGATASDSLSISGVSPKHPEFSAIQDRIASFRPWSFSHLQDPVYLVDAGFYYIGREDIVRCYFCDIGLAEWDAEDDPWVEHARHSPECEYLKKERGIDFIESIQSSWRQIYSPRHPEFSDYHVRIQSFTNWPTHLDQRPNILAEAGFFYTGEDDVVRCHYCDGGLRQWEAGDDPWTEHARWFPFCKYIVKIKGLVFIEEIARRYNEVYESSPNDPTTLQMVNEDQTSPGIREPYRTPLSSEVVERILELGYNRRQVNLAFHHHVQMTGRRHATADELTNILLENDFNVAPPVNNQPSSAAKENTKKTTSDIENLEPQKLVDLNLQLKQQLMCNICKQRESSIVFSPCGHRIACEECSRDTTVCFSCGDEIRKKIKTYLA